MNKLYKFYIYVYKYYILVKNLINNLLQRGNYCIPIFL